MKRLMVFALLGILMLGMNVYAEYRNGTLVAPKQMHPHPVDQFTVIDSFPSYAPSYSHGLAFDGQFLWNDETFSLWFARMDTTGGLLNSFTPAHGNRDMTFDGTYLWATDWQQASVYKYDTSTCTIVSSFSAPFSGKANGMAWDGLYLWIGQEGGQIWQVDASGTVIRWIPSPNSSDFNPRGLAFDGQHLWVGAQSAGLIYEIDTLDGSLVATYAAPSGNLQQGITFDGQYLWTTGGDNYIYKVDIGIGIEEDEPMKTTAIALKSFPNPFCSKTRIEFYIPSAAEVTLEVFDSGGRFIKSVARGMYDSGHHSLPWERKDLHAGIYFAVLKAANTRSSMKLCIID
jgi:hypothetical protein